MRIFYFLNKALVKLNYQLNKKMSSFLRTRHILPDCGNLLEFNH